MRNIIASIRSNEKIARDVYEMTLRVSGGTADIRPGQFLNIKLEGLYLRRPISICDWDGDLLAIIYKVVGAGTERLSLMEEGQDLDILLPLGNGYDLAGAGTKPLLIGGGVGVPPMYGLCRRLCLMGLVPTVILGFRSREDVFYEEAFQALGARTIVTTEDGSMGLQGFVTGAMKELEYSSLFACGPEAMLAAVDDQAPDEIPGQMSFEERMGCGFGACMGCSCKTKYGSKRICKDGPVLERSEILW